MLKCFVLRQKSYCRLSPFEQGARALSNLMNMRCGWFLVVYAIRFSVVSRSFGFSWSRKMVRCIIIIVELTGSTFSDLGKTLVAGGYLRTRSTKYILVIYHAKA